MDNFKSVLSGKEQYVIVIQNHFHYTHLQLKNVTLID